MATLSQVLEEVRRKIELYQGKEMNEQNTTTALIDPVLRALGWEVGNLDEVSQEYKRKPQDKPVDYALFVLRTPKVFVEAKALGQNLDDRKWAGQIMGYAAVAGVKWTVITNGDEYRIYNACVDVPVEEKLFRAVRITDPNSPVGKTLALLSKDRIKDNEIEVLWKAHFVDRQIRTALEELFSTDSDSSLVRLVRKRVTELSSRDIRASLARVRVRFDFPVEPETPTVLEQRQKSAAAKETWKTRRDSTPSAAIQPPKDEEKLQKSGSRFVGVKLSEVIAAGILKPPTKLFRKYKGKVFEATLMSDGTVDFRGTRHRTCSLAADMARRSITGRPMSTNGWSFWQYVDKDGTTLTLHDARNKYLGLKDSGT